MSSPPTSPLVQPVMKAPRLVAAIEVAQPGAVAFGVHAAASRANVVSTAEVPIPARRVKTDLAIPMDASLRLRRLTQPRRPLADSRFHVARAPARVKRKRRARTDYMAVTYDLIARHPASTAGLRAHEGLVVGHDRRPVEQMEEVAAPLGEQWALAEAEHVRFDRVPLHLQDERLGALDALVEDAAPVSLSARNHRTGSAKTVSESIRRARAGFQESNLDDHHVTLAPAARVGQRGPRR